MTFFQVKTSVLFISKPKVILSQITLNQLFFDYITYKNLDLNFSKSEIGQ